MRMRLLSIAFAVGLNLFINGCKHQVEQPAQRPETPLHDGEVEAAPLSTYVDSDDDGLCDLSELAAGTSVKDPDSDGDSYPDVIEVSYGLDPLDPAVPQDEQIVVLFEASGASATLIVQVEVDGVGEQFTGLFRSFDPISDQTTTAADLLVSVRATGADPRDNVHGIEENAARFASVQGLTELTFSLGFAYQELPTSECKRGYPFSFSVKRPDSSQVGYERYLLVSIPAESDSTELSWCMPDPCL